MTKQTIQRAYETVHPDDAARERMLEKLLSASTRLPERECKLYKQAWKIAVVIAAALCMIGCAAVYVLRLQDMKIAETTGTKYYNAKGELAEPTEVTKNVLSMHGLSGTPTYLAHQEWYVFLESYDPEGKLFLEAEENPIEIPEAYEAYDVYNQEMMDKVDEIAEKYGLNLLGALAVFQRWESDIFYEALGIDTLLAPGGEAVIEDSSGYFYEAGNFKTEFHMTMPKKNGNCPYEMLNTIYYSKAENFDMLYFGVDETENWKQWDYTTAQGAEVLIAFSPSTRGAVIICNREDALIYVHVDAYHQSGYDWETNTYTDIAYMTRRQLEQVADALDFGLTVHDVDMELARSKLAKFMNEE